MFLIVIIITKLFEEIPRVEEKIFINLKLMLDIKSATPKNVKQEFSMPVAVNR